MTGETSTIIEKETQEEKTCSEGESYKKAVDLLVKRGWKKEDINMILSLNHPLDILIFDELNKSKNCKRSEFEDMAESLGFSRNKVKASLDRLTTSKHPECKALVNKSSFCSGYYTSSFKVRQVDSIQKIPIDMNISESELRKIENDEFLETNIHTIKIIVLRKGLKNFSLWEFVSI